MAFNIRQVAANRSFGPLRSVEPRDVEPRLTKNSEKGFERSRPKMGPFRRNIEKMAERPMGKFRPERKEI